MSNHIELFTWIWVTFPCHNLVTYMIQWTWPSLSFTVEVRGWIGNVIPQFMAAVITNLWREARECLGVTSVPRLNLNQWWIIINCTHGTNISKIRIHKIPYKIMNLKIYRQLNGDYFSGRRYVEHMTHQSGFRVFHHNFFFSKIYSSL